MAKKLSLAEIQKLLAKIPRGKVVTYAELARALGHPRAAQAVGSILHKNPDCEKFPCFRVVRSDGIVGGFKRGNPEKVRRLRTEGIEIRNGRIQNFAAKKWSFKKCG